jgi:hypothetical protein
MSKNPEAQEQPLLFFKVGVFGGTPKGFAEEFAEEFKLDRFTSNSVREAIISQRVAKGDSDKSILASVISARLVEQVGRSLADGKDAMLDMFFNTPKRRSVVPIHVAHRAGALSVALNIDTPFPIVEDRIQRSIKEGTLSVPLEEWSVHPVGAAKNMASTKLSPKSDEDIGLIINIDGSGDVESLLDQIEAGLMTANLADPEPGHGVR